jgi:hypothetical protein
MVEVTLFGIGCARHKQLQYLLGKILARHIDSVTYNEVSTIEGIIENDVPKIPALKIGEQLHTVEGAVWDEQQIERWIIESVE